jgi:microcystin-dependent protein
MSEPYLSEIKIISWNFPPRNWALCNGQLLPINQNQALFSLLGTTYGGNGQTTFGLPNLQGRIPVHRGGGFQLGQTGGEENHTLTVSELPTHTHLMTVVTGNATTNAPAGALLASSNNAYQSPSSGNFVAVNPATVSNVGGSQAHTNLQPYLVLNFCIALTGIFPSQN